MSEKGSTIQEKLDRKCHCLFCGAEFSVRDIEFCIDAPNEDSFYDSKFEKHIGQYKGMDSAEIPYRAMIRWMDDPESNVTQWDEYDLPETVHGLIRFPDGYATQSGIGSFGFDMNPQETSPAEENSHQEILAESSIRICPECHMTLITGFNSDPVVRVGLLGGTRSGKTTYMIVASKCLEKRFAGNGDLDFYLGSVRFAPECRKFIDRLYENGIAPTVKNEIDLQIKDPPVFPVICRITPHERQYKPFILILQDIPGEYMNPDTETEQLLACSGINKSTDLIMCIDCNHFVNTRQKDLKRNADDHYGEYCQKDLNDLFNNYEVLGRRLDIQDIKSIQIVITKLDFMIEADPRLKATVFSHGGEKQHRGAISEKRLAMVHKQVESVLGPKENGGYGSGGLITKIVNPIKADFTKTHLAYTAVASKDVPDHDDQFESGIAVNYEYSLNVLEPLLHVFLSHKLLPSKKEEYLIESR